jgi:methyl-accepting chemotaxis protein
MHEVVSSIQRVTDIMAEISAASQEQTSGIEQINQAISQMDDVTQQNAGLVEEAAAASEALQNQAAKLAELVSVFRLGDRAPAVAAAAPVRAAKAAKVAKVAKAATALAAPKPARVVRPAPMRAPVKVAATAGDWEEF